MNRGGCFEFYFIFEPLLPIKELYFPELNSSEQLACDLHGFSIDQFQMTVFTSPTLT